MGVAVAVAASGGASDVVAHAEFGASSEHLELSNCGQLRAHHHGTRF